MEIGISSFISHHIPPSKGWYPLKLFILLFYLILVFLKLKFATTQASVVPKLWLLHTVESTSPILSDQYISDPSGFNMSHVHKYSHNFSQFPWYHITFFLKNISHYYGNTTQSMWVQYWMKLANRDGGEQIHVDYIYSKLRGTAAYNTIANWIWCILSLSMSIVVLHQ